MEHDFWHSRWEKNEIGFHQDEVNPYLEMYWSQMKVASGAEVFVPLCGKSRDMIWLREQGHEVLGVELSDAACEAFFAEGDATPELQVNEQYTGRYLDGITLLCGDFFQLQAFDLQNVSAVYDRAALVAMPEDMRQRYVQKMSEILPKGVTVLLVTLEFDSPAGPPFNVPAHEVEGLYGERFNIERLYETELIQIKSFMGREVVWRLTEKG